MRIRVDWVLMIVSTHLERTEGLGMRATEARELVAGHRNCRGWTVIGSSDKVHVVDALAITGEEGRGSLRKAAGSWQTSIDPQISEWGNPARKGHLHLNT